MHIQQVLTDAAARGASDLFLIAGLPLSWKLDGRIARQAGEKLSPAQTDAAVRAIYQLAGRDIRRLLETGDDDFSFALPGVSRFRACAYRQRGSLAVVVRIITFHLPDAAALGIPAAVVRLAEGSKGLVLVTGPAGSGKSTTLACMVDHINQCMERHVITLEDPIEYLHRHKRSIVSQREVGTDTVSYVAALRAALRQSPDVILLGEMRDRETISTAMTAAETGHLVISTLHTIGAANAVDRVLDAFPPNQQPQMAVQLSMVLAAVVSQQLVPSVDDKLQPAFELMTVDPAIRHMIRDNKVQLINSTVQSACSEALFSMDSSLYKLWQAGSISAHTALQYAANPDLLRRRL